MKILVLDTNILIDNVHGFAKWLDKLLKSSVYQLVIPTIVVAEYLTAQEVETENGKLKSANYLSTFQHQNLNDDIAEILGQILRRKSHVQDAGLSDLIIAATAVYLNAELATNNRDDFKNIPGLKFFDPKKL